MPIIKSAIKRMRQEAVRRNRNRQAKDELRARTKAFLAAVEAKDAKKLPGLLSSLTSQIDKGVKKNALPKNTAARKKARFARLAKQSGMKLSAGTTKPDVKKTSVKSKSAVKKTTKKKA